MNGEILALVWAAVGLVCFVIVPLDYLSDFTNDYTGEF